ncbi:regulatory protein [Streptococcus parauberis KRS-02083]|nr:regulatory protein [Streptococcus parauberis KRS-02083]
MRCHNALELGNEDFYLNFLVYDYRKEFLDYFSQDYPHFMQEVQKHANLMIREYPSEIIDYTVDHLTYLLLMTWENLFLHLSQHIEKQKLMVVERGKGSLGHFLQVYLGQFFEISIFTDYNLAHLNTDDCDLIITDTLLSEMESVTVLYFNKLVPAEVLCRLNDYLRKQLKLQFQSKYERSQLSHKL